MSGDNYMSNHQEEKSKAVSVIDEAANTYYENFGKMPDDVRKKVSCHILKTIFAHMVIPAIDKVRYLDRTGREQ